MFSLRELYVSVMAMAIRVLFSLKVCDSCFSMLIRYSINANIWPSDFRRYSDIISNEGVIYVLTRMYVPGIAKHIASCGYAVYAIDHPGFGLSEGLHGYVSSFDDIIDNVIEQFTIIKGVDCKVA